MNKLKRKQNERIIRVLTALAAFLAAPILSTLTASSITTFPANTLFQQSPGFSRFRAVNYPETTLLCGWYQTPAGTTLLKFPKGTTTSSNFLPNRPTGTLIDSIFISDDNFSQDNTAFYATCLPPQQWFFYCLSNSASESVFAYYTDFGTVIDASENATCSASTEYWYSPNHLAYDYGQMPSTYTSKTEVYYQEVISNQNRAYYTAKELLFGAGTTSPLRLDIKHYYGVEMNTTWVNPKKITVLDSDKSNSASSNLLSNAMYYSMGTRLVKEKYISFNFLKSSETIDYTTINSAHPVRSFGVVSRLRMVYRTTVSPVFLFVVYNSTTNTEMKFELVQGNTLKARWDGVDGDSPSPEIPDNSEIEMVVVMRLLAGSSTTAPASAPSGSNKLIFDVSLSIFYSQGGVARSFYTSYTRFTSLFVNDQEDISLAFSNKFFDYAFVSYSMISKPIGFFNSTSVSYDTISQVGSPLVCDGLNNFRTGGFGGCSTSVSTFGGANCQISDGFSCLRCDPTTDFTGKHFNDCKTTCPTEGYLKEEEAIEAVALKQCSLCFFGCKQNFDRKNLLQRICLNLI